MSMNFKRKLPIPLDIKKMFPLNEKMTEQKQKNDSEIKNILSGKSDKYLLITGPCSADSKDSVLEYISRLRILQEKVSEKIVILPRLYTNKPRTAGDGYRGMLHQPSPDEAPDMLKGIISIRDIHMTALKDYGFSCADELLYPDSYRYVSDILSYVAVGARSVENQQHRLTSSGLDIPVGMKNPPSGNLSVMLNAVSAAQHKQFFIYRGWEVESDGNEYAHCILRGYSDLNGNYISNYSYDNICKLFEAYSALDLKNPAVIIDTNHANSGKDCFKQPEIARDAVNSINKNSDIKSLVKGLMIESYIEDGSQCIGENVYGKSITDPCLGWEKTERLIYELAELL